MKTILTTLAIALMVFAFNTPSLVHATEESDRKAEEFLFGKPCKKVWKGGGYHTECQHAEIDEVKDPDEAESEVADSGNEGPTSAAQESDQ